MTTGDVGMRSLLVLTYGYPPCTLPPAWRVAGWARHLHESGWRPTIVCRYWTKGDDPYRVAGPGHVTREEHETHDVVWVPYLPNVRDRFIQRYGLARLVRVRQALSLAVAIAERASIRGDALRAYHDAARHELERRRFDGIVATGNPFTLFRIADNLARRHRVPWAADYRDSWSTNDFSYGPGVVDRFFRRADRVLERRWLASARFFTTVSPQYVRQIHALIRRPGHALLTGFRAEDFAAYRTEPLFPEFTVTYLGTMYPFTRFETFAEAALRLVRTIGPSIRFRVRLPGVAHVEGQARRIADLVRGAEQYFELLPRVDRAEALRIVAKSHLLLQVGYRSSDGVVGSKVYEYLASGRPIMICPSDDGVLAHMIGTTGAGYVVADADAAYDVLHRLYREYEATGTVAVRVDAARLEPYSQAAQVKGFGDLLNRHFLDTRANKGEEATVRA